MHSQLVELLSLSSLEKNRIEAKNPDPRNISSFAELEEVITLSLTPNAAKAIATTQIKPAMQAKPENTLLNKNRSPFQNDALLERLLKYRDQIPLSSKIIRATDT